MFHTTCVTFVTNKTYSAHVVLVYASRSCLTESCAPVCASINSAAVLESAMMDCFLGTDMNGVEKRPLCTVTPVCDFESAWQL